MIINLNTQVKAILTEKGINHLIAKREELKELYPQVSLPSLTLEDFPNNTYKTQMWSLMEYFSEFGIFMGEYLSVEVEFTDEGFYLK